MIEDELTYEKFLEEDQTVEDELTYENFLAVIINNLQTNQPQWFWLTTSSKKQAEMLFLSQRAFQAWVDQELMAKESRAERILEAKQKARRRHYMNHFRPKPEDDR